MANIIFYRSPVDIRETIKYSSDANTIIDVLRELNISSEPLAIRINGKSPDDIDLNLDISEDDFIEIARMVHGKSSGAKRTLGGFLQIAAFAALFIPGVGIFISAGLSLAAGYLNAQAAKIKAANQNKDIAEIDIESNTGSPVSAKNEMRPNQPMPIIFGSIRSSPDLHTYPCELTENLGSLFYQGARPAYHHIFNMGLGDLDVSDRQLLGIPISDINPYVENQEIEKNYNWHWPFLYISTFNIIAKPIQDRSLDNLGDTDPSSNRPLNDFSKSNWSFIDTPVGHTSIKLATQARNYYASNSGMANNTFTLEFQWKRFNATNYEGVVNPTNTNNASKRLMNYRLIGSANPLSGNEDRIVQGLEKDLLIHLTTLGKELQKYS